MTVPDWITPPAKATLPLLTAPPAVPAAPAQERRASDLAEPEPNSSNAAFAPLNSEPAPPLSEPREIRRIPRGPEHAQEIHVPAAGEPLRLPSSQPAVGDSLIGPQRW
jgi:hypothetical protein